MSPEDVLRTERRGRIAVLTIIRPQRRNAMDQALIDALKMALATLDCDGEIAAIVLNGTEPGFCAGSDLKFIGNLDLEEICRFEQETGVAARSMGFISKPIVAAVEGFAKGGGFILATSCDIVVTGANASWALPEVPIGWLTPWGLKSLVARVGPVKARNLCFCLETLSGEEAVRMGVADYSVKDGTALEAALAIAEKLSSLPGPAVAATKRFFSKLIMENAETMDFEANRLFAENCREPVARATLERFRSPSPSLSRA
jgi:enoyl-CoA hydratase/carnithine racemase